MELTDTEVRILGALVEKEMSTPDNYPLSLNALTTACNQKTSRDPVAEYDDQTVLDAIELLRQRQMAATLTGRDHRVPKYRHWLPETLRIGNRELAVLCVMMLRGPQTIGELKERTHRLHEFEDLSSVETCLQKLAERQPEPLAVLLPRRPGEREPRWAHLMSGEPVISAEPDRYAVTESPTRRPASDQESRIAALEAKVESLSEQVGQLVQQLEAFRRQFE
jgi:uncharacterized protein YceH (UPF0502 family)